MLFYFLYFLCLFDKQFSKVGLRFNFLFFARTRFWPIGAALYLTIACTDHCFGQFSNIAALHNIVSAGTNGNQSGVSTYDFNKDGWDDLTFATGGEGVRTLINNSGVFQEINLFNALTGNFRQVSWIDYDNDGDADFFASRHNSYCVLLRNDGNLTFTDLSNTISYPSYEAPCYGFSWGDYDNDGYPDVYICVYQQLGENTNWLLHNNGGESFTEVATELGVNNGVKATFQSSLFDYDLDNDVDLFVMNDREMINALYRNNGDGTFTDISFESGAGISVDAMGISWSDYDRDGDFDYFIPNTESGSLVMQNNEGVFTDVAPQLGLTIPGTVCWGAQWIDHSNNTFDDIYVATVSYYDGMQNYFYMRQENGTFAFDSLGCFQFDDIRSYSAGVMDVDNDGFADIAVTNVWPASLSLWHNDGVGGNYIKFGLTGSVSNRDAIGTTVQVFLNGTTLMKQVQCGEGFLTQNSQYMLFGCGENEVADSIYVRWPSGWVDRFYNLATNQFYAFIEGETFSKNSDIDHAILCPDFSLTLHASPARPGLWSTGEFASSIVVNEAGFYSQEALNELGLMSTYNVEVNEFTPLLPNVEILSPSCFGSVDGNIDVTIDSSVINSFMWIDGSPEDLFDVGSGTYPYILQYVNGCVFNASVVMPQTEPIELQWLSDAVCNGESVVADYVLHGGSIPYSIDWNTANPEMLFAGNYDVTIEDNHGCTLTQNVFIQELDALQILVNVPVVCYGETVSVEYNAMGGTGAGYLFNWNNADPENLGAGSYVVTAVDDLNCVASTSFIVSENPELFIDAIVQQQIFGGDASIVLNISGGTSPYSFLWSNDAMTSDISMLNSGIYQCNITDALGCQIVDEIFILELNVNDLTNASNVFPNPFNELISVTSTKPFSFQLCDAIGRIIYTGRSQTASHLFTTQTLPSGTYFLTIDDRIFKLIK